MWSFTSNYRPFQRGRSYYADYMQHCMFIKLMTCRIKEESNKQAGEEATDGQERAGEITRGNQVMKWT